MALNSKTTLNVWLAPDRDLAPLRDSGVHRLLVSTHAGHGWKVLFAGVTDILLNFAQQTKVIVCLLACLLVCYFVCLLAYCLVCLLTCLIARNANTNTDDHSLKTCPSRGVTLYWIGCRPT
jgi:hypothetical protein